MVNRRPSRRVLALRRRLRRVVRYLVSLNASPQGIARGMSIGMIVGFSPLYGFHMILAVVLATLCKASRSAAIIPVWVTNPLTILPIYSFTYEVGRWFLGGPTMQQVYRGLQLVFRRAEFHGEWELIDRFKELLRLGGQVLWPMTLGGLIVGVICALMVYPLTLYPVRYFRRVYDQRKERRRLRRLQSTPP